MALYVVTPPTAEPLHLDEAKLHLRVESSVTADDALISSLVTAARQNVEAICGRALISQTLRMTLDGFYMGHGDDCDDLVGAGTIWLPRSPAAAISSITYTDLDGTQQTLASTVYTLDSMSEPPRLALAWNQTWPSTRNVVNAVAINFIAGYATPAAADATANTLTTYGRTYANDDIVRVSNSGGSLPGGLSANTDYYVVNASGSAIKLSTTSGGAAIDLTSAGSGQHFIGEVPASIKAAMKLILAELYENRGDDATAMNPAVDRLLAPFRTFTMEPRR